jgi:hypothetical protein
VIPKVLHYWRCRVCASVMITAFKTGNYDGCNGCRSYMRWLFSETVETPEQQATAVEVAKLGKVFRWSPSHEPLAYTPSRQEFIPDPHATERRRQLEQEDQERMEAAYKAAEDAIR